MKAGGVSKVLLDFCQSKVFGSWDPRDYLSSVEHFKTPLFKLRGTKRTYWMPDKFIFSQLNIPDPATGNIRNLLFRT